MKLMSLITEVVKCRKNPSTGKKECKVYHCHGKDAGKPMSKKWMSPKDAWAQHYAIMKSKERHGK